MKLKLFSLMALVLTMLLLGLTACSVQEIQSLQGVLKNVDTVSGNLTVTLKDGSTFTYNFADINPASILDSQGNLRFNVGDNITVQVYKHPEITAPQLPAFAVGIIKAIGTGSITITTVNNGDVTLNVTSQTWIITTGKGKAALTDLLVGQHVQATYEKSSLKAYMIRVELQQEQASAIGTIKAVYTDNSSLTITTMFRGDITLQATADTKITIGGKGKGTFADLQAGQWVNATYDTTTMTASKISTNALWKKAEPFNVIPKTKMGNAFGWGKKS